jgi:hypothetical protein
LVWGPGENLWMGFGGHGLAGGLGSAVQRTNMGASVCLCKVRVIGKERGKEVVFLVEVVTLSLFCGYFVVSSSCTVYLLLL